MKKKEVRVMKGRNEGFKTRRIKREQERDRKRLK